MDRQASHAAEGKRIIGVAIDGSKQAELAFNHTVDRIYKDGRDFILLIHCCQYNVSVGMPGAFSKVDEICAQMKKRESEIDSLVSKYTQILREKGIPGRVFKAGGKPGEEIIKACTTEHVSELVMGTRGLSTIRRTILGSVSEYCIHHSQVPITIVPFN